MYQDTLGSLQQDWQEQNIVHAGQKTPGLEQELEPVMELSEIKLDQQPEITPDPANSDLDLSERAELMFGGKDSPVWQHDLAANRESLLPLMSNLSEYIDLCKQSPETLSIDQELKDF